MKSVLLTGEKGYLGQCLATLIDAHSDLERQCLKTRLQDIPPASLQADYVIHCAAVLEGQESDFALHNVVGTARLLAGLRQPTPVVLLSSRMVYGSRRSAGLYRESESPQPTTAYGRSKWEAEQLVIQSGHPALILRSTTLFGAAIHTVGRSVFDVLWQQICQQQVVTLYNPDSQRDYLYVWDLARAILSLLQRPQDWPPCLNAAGPRRSVQSLARLLIEGYQSRYGKQVDVRYQPGQGSHLPENHPGLWQQLYDWGQLTADEEVFARMWDFAGKGNRPCANLNS